MKSLNINFEVEYLNEDNIPIVITVLNNLNKDFYVSASDVFHDSIVDSRIKLVGGPSEVNVARGMLVTMMKRSL